MKNIKEIENKIFSCIILHPKILEEYDFDEKYFIEKNFLRYLIKCYNEYKNLEITTISQNGKYPKLISLCIELMQEEISWKSIYGYYKQLKEMWRDNQIEIITNQLKNKQIEFSEFSKQMFELTKDDFDDEELLTLDKINNLTEIEREYTEIRELDYLIKGLEYGRMNLWSGITNHGKTTLMIQIAKECLKKHKKIFYFSGEQSAEEFKNYLYVGMCNKDQLEFLKDKHNERIIDTKPKDEIINYFDNIYSKELFLYNNNLIENDINKMIKVMRKAFNQGVRIFFIDNFMQLDNSEMLEEQTKIVEQFKRFARDKKCIVNLVAHPRKTQFQKSRLTIFDIAGTQNIANKSANICTIMRKDMLNDNDLEEVKKVLLLNDYDIERCDSILEVLKTKGSACKMVGLVYDKETKTYKEAYKMPSDEAKKLYQNNQRKRRYEDE